jgi:hypothetical protein
MMFKKREKARVVLAKYGKIGMKARRFAFIAGNGK